MKKRFGHCLMVSLGFLSLNRENLWAQDRGYYHGPMMGPDSMHNWGMGWIGPILGLVFWILLLVVLFLVIRWLLQSTGQGRGERAGKGENALEILKARYARGEIDKAEFESKKRDLLE